MGLFKSLMEDYTQALAAFRPFEREYDFTMDDVVGSEGGKLICSLSLRDGRKLLFIRNQISEPWKCLGDTNELDIDENIFGEGSVRAIVEGMSEFERLKKNKVPLSDEEKKECYKQDAVWHYAMAINPLNGRKEQKIPAVWKAKDSDGKFIYITNTHRAWNSAKSLSAAINKYHNFIKGTA